MSDSASIQILYIGRKAQISEQLQSILAQRRHGLTPELWPANGKVRGTAARAVTTSTIELMTATNQKSALQLMRTQPPVAVFVELEQKSASRLRFCEVVRYRLPTATILALANQVPAGSFAFDGVLGLPLNAKEVIAVLNRLATKSSEHLLNHGPITLNMALRTVVTPNGQYTMTPKQCALLKLLMSEQGQVVERRKIMETVWETDYLEDTRTLDVHIRWLRERIEQNPSKPVYLKTVRGVGYRFDIPR